VKEIIPEIELRNKIAKSLFNNVPLKRKKGEKVYEKGGETIQ
jgi:hypothetical protein